MASSLGQPVPTIDPVQSWSTCLWKSCGHAVALLPPAEEKAAYICLVNMTTLKPKGGSRVERERDLLHDFKKHEGAHPQSIIGRCNLFPPFTAAYQEVRVNSLDGSRGQITVHAHARPRVGCKLCPR
jgi:hypothetical protein